MLDLRKSILNNLLIRMIQRIFRTEFYL